MTYPSSLVELEIDLSLPNPTVPHAMSYFPRYIFYPLFTSPEVPEHKHSVFYKPCWIQSFSLRWEGKGRRGQQTVQTSFFSLMVKASNVIKFLFVGKQLGFSIIKFTFLMPVLPIFLEKNRRLLPAISRM